MALFSFSFPMKVAGVNAHGSSTKSPSSESTSSDSSESHYFKRENRKLSLILQSCVAQGNILKRRLNQGKYLVLLENQVQVWKYVTENDMKQHTCAKKIT